MGPAVPWPVTALDLDAVSDYVPAPDDGLALDYGPVPDNDAARDYGKALDYGTPPDPAAAPPAPAAAPPAPAAAPAVAHVPPAGDLWEPDPAVAHVPPAGDLWAPDPAVAHVPPAGDLWAPDPAAGQVSPATYWRRRLVALGVGIAVLTVLVWAVSGVLRGTGQATGHGGKPAARPGAARGRPAAAHGHQGGNRAGPHGASDGGSGHTADGNAPRSLPVSAAGRAATISAMAGHRAPGTLSGVSDVLTMAGARQQKGSAASRTPPHLPVARAPEHRAMARAVGPQVAACGRGDVVLSLVSPRYWYQPGRWPLFGVGAVSTAGRPCRFNMGSRFATVVVTSGRSRIWGSADCAHGTGSQSVVLSRGRPAVRWIYWDRATSSPGCRPPHLPVHQGAYTAIAFDGQLSSQVMVFILGLPATSLP